MYRIVLFLALFLVACGGGSDVEEYRLPVADCSLSSRDSYSEEEITGPWECVDPYYSYVLNLNPDNTGTAIVRGEGIVSGTWSVSGCILELYFENPGSGNDVIVEAQILELTDSYAELITSDAAITRCTR